jgi:hypothetical protein
MPTWRESEPGLVPAHVPCVSFGLYLVGIVLVVAGLIYAAVIMSVPTQWIIVLSLLLLGGGIVTAVKSTRQRDPIK